MKVELCALCGAPSDGHRWTCAPHVVYDALCSACMREIVDGWTRDVDEVPLAWTVHEDGSRSVDRPDIGVHARVAPGFGGRV
jgi:NMD protein affecting ribosome stability and mRNA decay